MYPLKFLSSASVTISSKELSNFVQKTGFWPEGTQNSSPTARYLSELLQKDAQLHASLAVTLILALVREVGHPELAAKILYRLEANVRQTAEVDLKTLATIVNEAKQAIDFERKSADSTKAIEFFLALEKGELRTKYLAKFEEHQKAATLTHHKVGEILSEWITEKCGPEVAARLKRDCFDEAFCRQMPLYATGTEKGFSPSDLLSAEVLFEVELNEWVASASPEERRQESAQLIRECKEKQNPDLRLSSLNLRTLPPVIGSLFQLQKLDVSNNQLPYLPNRISRLQNLQKLDLSNNELRHLPSWIGEFRCLTSLDVGANGLESLPVPIGQLSNLRELLVSDNLLTILPDSMDELQSLQVLHIADNRMHHLSASIRQLLNLQELVLANNGLQDLPVWIVQLQSLRKLDLSNNKLRHLPAWISQLQNLQDLYISDNQLQELPDSIGQLQNLRRLRTYNNRLRSLPVSIGGLLNLEQLDAESNQLWSLPDSITSLPVDCTINIESNPLSQMEIRRLRVQLAARTLHDPSFGGASDEELR